MKESNSAQVISRKEETLDTSEHKGTTLRVGFSTKQAGWVNSKEKNIHFLQIADPSDSKKADWERENTPPCSRGKVMIDHNHESVLLHQKKKVVKWKW